MEKKSDSRDALAKLTALYIGALTDIEVLNALQEKPNQQIHEEIQENLTKFFNLIQEVNKEN